MQLIVPEVMFASCAVCRQCGQFGSRCGGTVGVGRCETLGQKLYLGMPLEPMCAFCGQSPRLIGSCDGTYMAGQLPLCQAVNMAPHCLFKF